MILRVKIENSSTSQNIIINNKAYHLKLNNDNCHEKFINEYKQVIVEKNINIQNRPLININKTEFLQWFVGFTDAEGCFLISMPKNTKEAHFVFQITLHIDDLETLYLIKDKIGIGNVTFSKSTASFKVHSFKDNLKLVSIFNKYSLLTHKQIDFCLWKQAIDIKNSYLESLNVSKKKSFDLDTYNKLLTLKKCYK